MTTVTIWLAVGVFEIGADEHWGPALPDHFDRWFIGALVAGTLTIVAIVALRSSLSYQVLKLGGEIEREKRRRGARRSDLLDADTGDVVAVSR